MQAAAGSIYCFGAYKVDVAKREFRYLDTVVDVAPLIFEVLVFLIENRARVVHKSELFAELWRGSVVTDGSLARAIYKTRLLIGDSANNPRLIRTVNRVGYRFVGDITVHLHAENPVVDPEITTRDVATINVALLPFVNGTGQRENDWLELGLMSLVRLALKADKRLIMVPVSAVNSAMADLTSKVVGLKEAQLIQNRLKADCVIQCCVCLADGKFGMSFVGYGLEYGNLTGYLADAELMVVGQQLADIIEAELWPNHRCQVLLPCADPFANQVFARALDAQEWQKFETAAKYYRIILELEPTNINVLVFAVRCISAFSSEEAVGIGRLLMLRLTSDTDKTLKASAYEAVGAALWQDDPDAGAELIEKAFLEMEGSSIDSEMEQIFEWWTRNLTVKNNRDSVISRFFLPSA